MIRFCLVEFKDNELSSMEHQFNEMRDTNSFIWARKSYLIIIGEIGVLFPNNYVYQENGNLLYFTCFVSLNS